jgi:hypothetical protein
MKSTVLKKITLLLVVISIILGTPAWTQSINVSKGKAPLIDGNCAKSEWHDATHLPLGANIILHIKKNSDYVFIAVEAKSPTDSIPYVSLYLSVPDNRIIDLHSSGRLGERVADDAGNYPDWAKVFPNDSWFNHIGWTSNYGWFKCRPSDCSTMKFARSKEFQIDRSKFKGSEWKLFIYCNFKQGGQWKAEEYPHVAKNNKPDDWLILKL